MLADEKQAAWKQKEENPNTVSITSQSLICRYGVPMDITRSSSVSLLQEDWWSCLSSPCEYEIGELRNAQLIHCSVLAPFQGFWILISTTKKEETFNIPKESSLIHSVTRTHTHVVSQTGSRFVDLQALLFSCHSCRRLWLFFTGCFCFGSVLCFFFPKDLDGCLNYNNNTFKSRRHVSCTIDFEPWDYCFHDGSSHGTFQICSGLSGDVRWRWEVLSNLPYFDSTINIGIQRYQRGCHVSNTWQGQMEPMMPWPRCQSSFRPGFTEFCQWVRSMKYEWMFMLLMM